MSRIIQEIEYEFPKLVKVVKIDIEEAQRAGRMPLITRLPTIIISAEEKVRYRLTGLQYKSELVRLCAL